MLITDSQPRQAPRWIRFSNTLIEAGVNGVIGGVGLSIEAGRDVRYQGYFASSDRAVFIGPKARSIDISHTEFTNIGGTAVSIASGASDVRISDNTFDQTALTNKTVPAVVSVEAGAFDFFITGNSFQNPEGMTAPSVRIAKGAQSYSVRDNNQGTRAATIVDENGR